MKSNNPKMLIPVEPFTQESTNLWSSLRLESSKLKSSKGILSNWSRIKLLMIFWPYLRSRKTQARLLRWAEQWEYPKGQAIGVICRFTRSQTPVKYRSRWRLRLGITRATWSLKLHRSPRKVHTIRHFTNHQIQNLGLNKSCTNIVKWTGIRIIQNLKDRLYQNNSSRSCTKQIKCFTHRIPRKGLRFIDSFWMHFSLEDCHLFPQIILLSGQMNKITRFQFFS